MTKRLLPMTSKRLVKPDAPHLRHMHAYVRSKERQCWLTVDLLFTQHNQTLTLIATHPASIAQPASEQVSRVLHKC